MACEGFRGGVLDFGLSLSLNVYNWSITYEANDVNSLYWGVQRLFQYQKAIPGKACNDDKDKGHKPFLKDWVTVNTKIPKLVNCE